MSNGLLKFLASPAGQRFGAGMKGLSAGLLQAGAPRVGAPGPNAWGAGLQGMSAGIEAERQREIAEQQRAMQEQLMQMKIAEAKAVQAEKLRIDRLKNSAFMDGGIGAPLNAPKMTPRERLAIELAPEQWATGLYKEPKQPQMTWAVPKGGGQPVMMTKAEAASSGATKPPTPQYFDANAALKQAQIKGASGRYETAMGEVNAADATLANVTQMMDLVDRVDSGSFAEARLFFKKAGKAVGLDFDVSDEEAMKSKGMGFVMDLIGQTKGAISEKEMAAFKQASAGLGNTPAGNKMVLDLMTKIAERKRYEAQAVRNAYEKNPMISVVKLDNVRLQARKEFGSILPSRPNITQPPASAQPVPPAPSIEELLRMYPKPKQGG